LGIDHPVKLTIGICGKVSWIKRKREDGKKGGGKKKRKKGEGGKERYVWPCPGLTRM